MSLRQTGILGPRSVQHVKNPGWRRSDETSSVRFKSSIRESNITFWLRSFLDESWQDGVPPLLPSMLHRASSAFWGSPIELNKSICALSTQILILDPLSKETNTAIGRGRAEENVVRDGFTAPDKVEAPRVCMCRIDYQTQCKRLSRAALQTHRLQTTQTEADRGDAT